MPGFVVHWILLLAPVPLLTAGVVGVVRLRYLDRPMRWLLVLVGCGLLMEVASRLLSMRGIPNLFLAPLDTVLEFSVLAWLYRLVLPPGRLTRALPAVIGLFLGFTVVGYLQPTTSVQFSPAQHFLESLLVLALALRYFYELSQEEEVMALEREPMFWVSAGLLVYFAGNVLTFLFSNYLLLTLSKAQNQLIWAVHALLFMLLGGCYTLALWLSPRTSA